MRDDRREEGLAEPFAVVPGGDDALLGIVVAHLVEDRVDLDVGDLVDTRILGAERRAAAGGQRLREVSVVYPVPVVEAANDTRGEWGAKVVDARVVVGAAGYRRGGTGDAAGAQRQRRARLLYFAYLAQYLRKESEEVTLPAEVTDVTGLLAWLRRRERERGYLLADDKVRVTVNRQFTEPFTRLDDGDEIAIVPTSPTPPPPPKAARAAPDLDG